MARRDDAPALRALELLEKLKALTPRPEINLVLYQGEQAESRPPPPGSLLAGIDAQLRSLPSVSGKVTRIEQLDLDSKIRTAALPAARVVEKLVRYETSNDRELDRALKRLERMQERRRATGGTHPTN